MFNMHDPNRDIDNLIAYLAAEAQSEPEIKAAIGCLIAAKRLLQSYSQRINTTPLKADLHDQVKAALTQETIARLKRDRYHGWEQNGEFDDAETLFRR